MNVLLKILSAALVAQKTLTAVGASIIITVGVYEYLKNRK
jgi:hypothetical protein